MNDELVEYERSRRLRMIQHHLSDADEMGDALQRHLYNKATICALQICLSFEDSEPLYST